MRINLYTSYIYINYKWISVCYHQCVIMTNRLSETNTLFFIVIIDDHYFAKNEINHFVKQIYSNSIFRLSNIIIPLFIRTIRNNRSLSFQIYTWVRLFKYSVLVLSLIYYKSLTGLLNIWNKISPKAFIGYDSQGSNLVVFLLYSVANLNGGYFFTSEISKSICRVPSTLLY